MPGENRRPLVTFPCDVFELPIFDSGEWLQRVETQFSSVWLTLQKADTRTSGPVCRYYRTKIFISVALATVRCITNQIFRNSPIAESMKVADNIFQRNSEYEWVKYGDAGQSSTPVILSCYTCDIRWVRESELKLIMIRHGGRVGTILGI